MPGSLRYPLIGLMLAGCGTEPDRVRTDPGREANRVSMALRGVPPTAAEIAWVRQDDGALDALTDQWLADPRFAETVADWHAEMLLLRHDTQVPLPPRGPLEGVDRGRIGDSMAEAPLRRIAALVRDGRPYSELFEGREVAVDAITAEVWGLPYDVGGGSWQIAHWSDGRAAGGILVDSNLWARHISSDTNHQRARANLVHRVWLCEDLSARILDLGELDLGDAGAVQDAVQSQGECAGCHQTLDPLASTFVGWRRYVLPAEVADAYDGGCVDPDFCYPIRLWAPDRVPSAADLGLPDPAFGGEPVADLAELGQRLLADPRFDRCVARQLAGYLGQEAPADVPTAEVDRLADTFGGSGRDLRALARAIVRSDRFAAQGGEVGPLVARPEQVARTMEELTGLVWEGDPDAGDCPAYGCWGAVDLARNARWGFREIAGGIDGYDSVHPVHAPQPLRHLAIGRMAEEIAGRLVVEEAGLGRDERRLLTEVDGLDEDRAEPVRRQIAALYRDLLGETPDGASLDQSHALWQVVRSGTGSGERAWAALIAAMLQAPDRRVY